MQHSACSASVALPDRGRVLSFPSAGGAKPIAVRGGLEGFTPPHRFKARTQASDGQRIFTRAARSAGLRFAVRSLSKTMDVGRDHLIHRKRSPFPYEGKDITRLKLRRDFPCRTRHFPHCGERSVAALPGGAKPFAGRVGWRGGPLRTASRRGQRLSTDSELSPAPREAPGSGLR